MWNSHHNNATYGAAIGATLYSNVTMQNNSLVANNGSAIEIYDHVHLNARNSHFKNNSTPYQGAAILVRLYSSVQMSYCSFEGNTALSDLPWVNLTLANVFYNVTVNGGAIVVRNFSEAHISDTVFSRNTASAQGGGHFCSKLCFINNKQLRI